MGLRYSDCGSNFVIARDINRGKILIGGLGVFSVGEMWFDEQEQHKRYPGYDEAEIKRYTYDVIINFP